MTGVLGYSLSEMLVVEALASHSTKRPRAKNVLVVLEQGAMSHVDTWDPKPDVATDHRSPFKPVSTNVPGIQFTELLSHTARIADKLAVVRSMFHPKSGANGHPKGTQYMLSGSHPGGPIEMPDIGSVVAKIQETQCSYLPPYIMVPGNSEQAKESRTGFLSASMKVFKTGGKDVSSPEWRVADLLPRTENSEARLDGRRRLLSNLESEFVESNRGIDGVQRFYEQALDTLRSTQVSQAFDLQREPESIRRKYGPGHRGACYLVGRKLIEAGVRFVTVDVRWPRTKEFPKGTNMNWDHHDFIYSKGTCNLPGASGAGGGRRGIGTWEMMGSTDQAFAALIEDMDDRGLLAETLVCFISEFGRTPRINKFQGRDHWTSAYSITFAGAGVRGGQIIGRSDRDGGYVADKPHTPEEYASTIYDSLGIDRDKPLYTPSKRPVLFGHAAEPIGELF
ncbi:MAG: DUF1501 domain-containing protein [Planctomycetes bacterium]|nr:DUF1501 domain-containing protein [Planctomycetota bacterium]